MNGRSDPRWVARSPISLPALVAPIVAETCSPLTLLLAGMGAFRSESLAAKMIASDTDADQQSVLFSERSLRASVFLWLVLPWLFDAPIRHQSGRPTPKSCAVGLHLVRWWTCGDCCRWAVARHFPKSQIQTIYAEHSAAHAGNG